MGAIRGFSILGNTTGRRRTLVALLLTVALSSGLLSTERVLAAPAHNGGVDGLAQVGPVDHSAQVGGFPLWYKDTNGLRLELCLDETDVHCIAGPRPAPSQPVEFPGNFPDEAFWWAGVSDMRTSAGNARLVMALEAAFSVGPVVPGDQVAFSRIRLRVDGLPVGVYTVTHPYGVDQYIVDPASANATRSINNTRDTGDFSGGGNFDVALNGRTGPFLVWDSDQALLPAGYLADPLVPHTVTGSPYNTNLFRIEGPAGAFSGSPNVCPGVVDASCISTDLFTVQAKQSVRAGVEVTRAGYTDDAGSGYVDVFASSVPGQSIMLSGNGILETQMVGDGSGRYFARVAHGTAIPTNLVVRNITDNPPSEAQVTTITDSVHISGATFDRDLSTMTVTATSSDSSATLNLAWGGAILTSGLPGATYTFEVQNVTVPPVEVSVVSSSGGVDSDDVVITGGGLAPVPLVAVVNVPNGPFLPGEVFSLDGSLSTGSPDAYVWTQTAGAPIPPFDGLPPVQGQTINGLVAPDLGSTGGQLAFSLTAIRGAETSVPTSIAIDINGISTTQTPIADAGPDQLGLVPGSQVVLDGTASQNAATYSWTQIAGVPVVLSDGAMPSPSFTAPADAGVLTFELTTSNAAGSNSDLIDVAVDVDDLTVLKAQFKGGGKAEWRVTGTAQYCSGTNTITLELMRLSPASTPISVGVIGTTIATPAAPGCDWQLRLRGTPSSVNAQRGDWIRATSSLGGFRDNQQIQRG